MKRLVLIVLMLSLVFSGVACNKQQLKERSNSAVIRVTNNLGRGVEGAEVKLKGIKIRSKKTDKNGIVKFKVFPGKKYNIIIKKQGYKDFKTEIFATKKSMKLPFKLKEAPSEKIFKITEI